MYYNNSLFLAESISQQMRIPDNFELIGHTDDTAIAAEGGLEGDDDDIDSLKLKVSE